MTLELIELKAKSGVKKKTPLLFVHGSFCSAPIWRYRFMPYFSDCGHDCYAVSLSGHGRSGSEWSLHLYSLNDYVDNLIEAIEKIGEPPILVGHSLGGMVVQKYIESHDCAGAILMNSLPPSGAFTSIVHMMTHSPELYWTLNQAMMFSTDLVSFDALKRMLVTDDTHPASLAEVHGLFQPESMRALNDVTYFDIPRKRAKEGFPIKVIGGDADVMIPVTALKETATFHGADLTIIKGGPHALMLDKCWKDVAEVLRGWIEGKSAGFA
ncbi:alpha/beta hydrolase [Terasakiella sp. A23]|uniref:alpha/beta fold hydrolase n=1 Tax=Terasakiella sp. FCG-A23 TaxID=3080561 RepID=UPI002954359B|nr:alpha/beta hydrolase [Terasakiella sp. A23]MDV7340423.1 alpha/beta hydrolase [Terasakiella sp. A23]